MVGKFAPKSPYFTRGLVKYVSGGAIFVPSPPKTGTNLRHPRPLQSLNDSALIGRFQPKLPPLPQEHPDSLRAKVNWLKQGILPPPSPPQYESSPRPPFSRSPPPPPCLAFISSGNVQEERQEMLLDAPAGREKIVPGTMESEREYLLFESSLTEASVRTPEQQRLSCRGGAKNIS